MPIPCNSPASVQEYEEILFDACAKYGVQKGHPLTAEQCAAIETFQTIDLLAKRYPELDPASHRNSSTALPTPPPTAAPRFGQGPLPDRVRAGRNDPCPCGSGKKFKQCCLRRN